MALIEAQFTGQSWHCMRSAQVAINFTRRFIVDHSVVEQCSPGRNGALFMSGEENRLRVDVQLKQQLSVESWGTARTLRVVAGELVKSPATLGWMLCGGRRSPTEVKRVPLIPVSSILARILGPGRGGFFFPRTITCGLKLEPRGWLDTRRPQFWPQIAALGAVAPAARELTAESRCVGKSRRRVANERVARGKAEPATSASSDGPCRVTARARRSQRHNRAAY